MRERVPGILSKENVLERKINLHDAIVFTAGGHERALVACQIQICHPERTHTILFPALDFAINKNGNILLVKHSAGTDCEKMRIVNTYNLNDIRARNNFPVTF